MQLVLEGHSKLPSDIPTPDREIIPLITSKVQLQYAGEDKSHQERLIAQSYFLYKECEEHPEKRPEMQLAMAGALPLINMTNWLIGAIVGGGVAAKIILDKQENDEYHGLTQEQQAFERSKHDNKLKQKLQQQKNHGTTSFMPDPDDFEPDEDEFTRFKKKDGSNRYECEKSESPQWNETQHFKDEFRTNGKQGKYKEYYRWDRLHKDIEVYNDKAQLLGSKDPVTGKMYRQGNMQPNNKLQSILK